jgi:transposase
MACISLADYSCCIPYSNSLLAVGLACCVRILNYCRTQVRFGAVEAINGNIKTILKCKQSERDT